MQRYLTEKLFDAFNAGCIPIYWGDTSLRCDVETNRGGLKDSIDMRIPNIPSNLLEYKINPKAFINAHNFATLEDLMREVVRIDNDAHAYEAMQNEPIFLGDFNPKEYYEKRLFEFLDSIVSQDPKSALRRGSGHFLHAYCERKKRMRKIKKYLNIALRIRAKIKRCASLIFTRDS